MKFIELYFFRHGIAVDRSDPTVTSDPDRPLTEEGIRKTRAAAEGLRRMQIGFDRLLTSPWLRAAQTAAILAEVLGTRPPEELPELAGDRSAEELLAALARERGRRMLLSGHQPLLGDTVSMLLTGTKNLQIDLKKSGICAVEIDALPGTSPGTLMWMLTSKQLRMIGKDG